MSNKNESLSEHAKTHINVWKFGHTVHSPLLLAMATEEDYPGLMGFLEAANAGALSHARLKMSQFQHLEAHGVTHNYFRKRGQLENNSSELNLPLMEILALPLSSEHAKFASTTTTKATPDQRKYFDYAIEILGRIDDCNPDQLTDQERSLPKLRDRFIAAIVGSCRDPEIISQALESRGSISGAIYARPSENDRQDDLETNLTRIAAGWANPVAINVLINKFGAFSPVKENISNESIGQEILESFVLPFGPTPIYTKTESYAEVLAKEIAQGRQHDEYSMGNALHMLLGSNNYKSLKQARNIEIAQPYVHSELLQKSMHLSVKMPNVWRPVNEALMSYAPEDMKTWYTKEVGANDIITLRAHYKRIANETLQIACFSGNSQVVLGLAEHGKEMLKKIEQNDSKVDVSEKNRTITRLGNTVEKMVEEGSQIPLTEMIKTVDAMIDFGGYDLETFESRQKIEDRFNYEDAPQSNLLHRLARAIHKNGNNGMELMTHLVIRGADPEVLSSDGITISNSLRNKELRDEWKRISKGIAAKNAAMDIIEELGLFSSSP